MPDFFDMLSLRFNAVLPQVVAGMAVAGAFWLLARFVGAFVMRFQARVDKDHKDLIGLLADVLGWALFGLGAIAGLGTAGVNVAPLVAGLGLTGFVVGIAMKDIVSNLIAGLLIMLFRPYGRGDKIRIDKFQGIVTDVDLRYTTLEAPGVKVLIPNALAQTQAVVVMNADATEEQAAAVAPAQAASAATPAPALNVKAASKPTPGPTPGA